MNSLKKRTWVIVINTLAVLVFYYLFIKHFLRIELNDALGLIAVGIVAYIVGIIYYLRYLRKSKPE